MPDFVDEFARNMGRMRALIASSLEASISVGDRHGWQPEAGSTAACEREDAPAGNGVALAVEVGWNLMGAQALEGIETIAHLLRARADRPVRDPVARDRSRLVAGPGLRARR